jgi:elongation factor P
MASYDINSLKNGLKILIDGAPHNITDLDLVKPGKGQAFTRVKAKNLLDGRVRELTYKSGEMIEGADVLETSMQYLYSDGTDWHFMDPATYEQHSMTKNQMGTAADYLKEQDEVSMTLFNGRPIAVSPPNHVVLKVTQTDPGLRGDTSSGGSKPATTETGAVVKVPLFINEGDFIRVDTRSNEYISRAKEE